MKRPRNILELFSQPSKNDCWMWEGSKNIHGYGRISNKIAHRAVWELLVGEIPEGLTLDHLCRVQLCVNPTHLEPVSSFENCRRAGNRGVDENHCKNGHEYTDINTYHRPRGGRDCRTCIRNRVRRYQLKKLKVA